MTTDQGNITPAPTDSEKAVVHYADQEGTRLCGATAGVKTVFRPREEWTCPACVAIEPVSAELEPFAVVCPKCRRAGVATERDLLACPAAGCDGVRERVPAEKQLVQADELGSYSEMFAEYVAESKWIGPADRPLVFHLQKLCRQIDATGGDAKAALSSAYLQAFSRLDRRRPGSTEGATDPQQTTIFDELGS